MNELKQKEKECNDSMSEFATFMLNIVSSGPLKLNSLGKRKIKEALKKCREINLFLGLK